MIRGMIPKSYGVAFKTRDIPPSDRNNIAHPIFRFVRQNELASLHGATVRFVQHWRHQLLGLCRALAAVIIFVPYFLAFVGIHLCRAAIHEICVFLIGLREHIVVLLGGCCDSALVLIAPILLTNSYSLFLRPVFWRIIAIDFRHTPRNKVRLRLASMGL